jgi:hypothetical protein
MFKLAVFADRCRLAVTLRVWPFDAQRRHRPRREQFAEFLANRNQRREILNIFSGKRILDHGDGRGAAGWRRDGASHFQIGLFNDRNDLANDRAHRFPPCPWLNMCRTFYSFLTNLARFAQLDRS